ncbi:MAG: hypothetical protein M1818_000907 [Claussenomyces sp. TS43310]|nr:MAG: hypothetical protein M1818_000907 [Claussenomyces sp. TS43310]
MDVDLEALSLPVALSDVADGFIVKEETTIFVRCHDRLFKSVTVVGEAGQELFTAESKGMGSWTWRRTVKDVSGRPLFDLRHFGYTMKNKWAVESQSGREICTVQHVTFLNKERSALDVMVRNEADKGREVMIEVRPKDRSALRTLVNVEGAPVAEIRLLEANDVHIKGLDRSVWKARVAGGVDLALILVIILCRAEMHHVWRK